MPIDFNYDSKKLALYGVMKGDLTIEDYTSAFKEIVSSDCHPSNIRTLWDLSGLNFAAVSRPFIDRLIEVRASLPERRSAKIAIVVAGDLGFGMSRMFQILSESLSDDVMVFRDCPEAEAWLLSE